MQEHDDPPLPGTPLLDLFRKVGSPRFMQDEVPRFEHAQGIFKDGGGEVLSSGFGNGA
jgi:hypothetical protein